MKTKRTLKIGVFLMAAIIVVGLVIIFTDSPTIYADSNDKIPTVGFVNIQVIFQQHPDKFKAEMLLHEKASEMQGRLEEEAKDLSGEDKEALIEKYHLELMELEQKLIEDVVTQMNYIITEVAKQSGVAVVLDSQNVIYGGLDLTQAVLELIREATDYGDN